MADPLPSAAQSQGPNEPAPREEIPVFDSQALLGSAGQVWIHHAGQRYILRQTRQGKLLMTKS